MKVLLSKLAVRKKAKLLEGIAIRHSIEIALDVNQAIEGCIINLPNMPYMWPEIETRKFGKIRKATIKNLTVLLYKIQGNNIRIITITDIRSNWL